MPVYDKRFLIHALRTLDAAARETMTVIVIRAGDPFDVASLGRCPDCQVPGLPHGQRADWRTDAGAGEGLHGYVFDDRVEWHLDKVNACRDKVGHLLRDTKVVEGLILGGVGAAAVAAIFGAKPAAIAKAATAGMTGGACLGAYQPARSKRVIEFRSLIAAARTTKDLHGWAP